MKWYLGLESIVKERVPLADKTWYQIGGAAKYFCTPNDINQLREVVSRCTEHGLPFKVLGEGANVLVRDEGYAGVVIKLGRAAFAEVRVAEPLVIVGAAVDLPTLIRRTIKMGLAGLETLAGIPGTVGGCIRMNAGGQFGTISEHLTAVSVINKEADIVTLKRDALDFSYRQSNLGDGIVVEAVFELERQPAAQLLSRYKNIWHLKKESQPFSSNSAGCMFKNPDGHHAGALIDEAGLKGTRFGGASVSERHANFIVAEPHARTNEVLQLATHIRESVKNKFDIELELEVDVW